MDWIFEDELEDADPFDLPPPERHRGAVRPWMMNMTEEALRANDDSRSLLRSLSPEERSVLPQQLNQMQSRVLPTILGTDESVVLSAPTGAGKTCVLDMAILRSLLVDGGCRIYYVAPSKALCRLQGLGFSQRFRRFNLAVDVVTGDDAEEADDDDGGVVQPRQPLSVTMTSIMFGNPQGTAIRPKQHSLVVCTPEKLEAETRRCTDKKLLSNQKVLLLVDEVHHLGEHDRGATLELVLTRFLWAFRQNRQNLRFVCVSATIPNVDMVARWLSNATYFEFHNRPVPLTVRVLGFAKSPSRADYLFEQDLDRQVPEVLRSYGTGKPALVFVSSRKGAKDLAVKLQESGFGSRNPNTRGLQASDEVLTECLRSGIGFHSAALCASDRALVENLFREGKLLVVCCTSTLAVGVDLPANLVIVKSTRAYRGPLLGFQDLERATLIQMIGRAGRPGYDTEGTAVIMTAQGEESKYLDLSNGLLAVTSRLSADVLQEALNAEIVPGRLRTANDCAEWWSMTFAGVSSNAPWNGSELKVLEQMRCIRIQETDDAANLLLEATATGRTACTHHLRLATVAKFSEICNDAADTSVEKERMWDLEALARLICDGAEFQDLIPRRDQKKFLNSIAWNLGRFKSPKSARVTESKDVAFQLLQARLGGIPLTDNTLRQNCNHVLERAPRLARALLKMLVDARSNKSVVCALLCKCLEARCWETDELGQLEGVGAKTKEKLEALGLHMLSDAVTPANAAIVPPKALAHAKAIVASRRTPSVSFSDSALVISLSPPPSGISSNSSSGKLKRGAGPSNSDWWLACVGGPQNKLLGWSETIDRIVVPAVDVKLLFVVAIHRKAFAIDTKLVVEVDKDNRKIHVVSTDSRFWDGFHLASATVRQVAETPKTQRTKAQKTSTGRGGANEKQKLSKTIDSFFSTDSEVAKRVQDTSVSLLSAPVVRAPLPAPGQAIANGSYDSNQDPVSLPATEKKQNPWLVNEQLPPNQTGGAGLRNAFATYANHFQAPIMSRPNPSIVLPLSQPANTRRVPPSFAQEPGDSSSVTGMARSTAPGASMAEPFSLQPAPLAKALPRDTALAVQSAARKARDMQDPPCSVASTALAPKTNFEDVFFL